MYSNLHIAKNERSMDEICNIHGSFEYQKQQQFIQRWFQNGNKKLLLFHGLGSGKTCSSILAMKSLQKKIRHTYVVTPASLIGNYKKELRGECGKFKKIPKGLTIVSHQKFPKLKATLSSCLVIIDEVQNIVSSSGSTYKQYFEQLVTKSPKNLHVILLSATPMFDQPHEIALTMNLLNLPKPLPVLKFYTEYLKKDRSLKNGEGFLKRIEGYVSAFKGVSPNAYAKRKDVFVSCRMSNHQLGSYTKAVQGLNMKNIVFSQAFLSGPRLSSNVVYENGGFGKLYRPSDSKLENLFRNNIEKYSCKFKKCIDKLENVDGPAFVYSNFVASCGINDFAICLRARGYKEAKPFGKSAMIHGKRFAVFKTGKAKENEEIIKIFNSIENKKGNIIKAILGSPAMKEGISLKNTRSVHLLDPYWNKSRTEQIIGRAIRFCSHVLLPPSQRKVDVYHYISQISSNSRKTVDQHIVNMSKQKAELIEQFEKLLYSASVDCELFHRVNGLNISECAFVTQNYNYKEFINQSYKILVDDNGISKEKDKERRLLDILQDQGINEKEKRFGFKVTLFAPKRVEFKFQNSKLNSKIHSQTYKLNEEHSFAIVKLSVKKIAQKKKENESINDSQIKHLKFNQGASTKIKLGKGRHRTVPLMHKSCPIKRRPVDGKCPKTFPFLQRDDELKKECCYKRPIKSKGVVKTHEGKVYIDGKLAQSMTYKQLTEAAKSFGKNIDSKMKRKNIIKSFH